MKRLVEMIKCMFSGHLLFEFTNHIIFLIQVIYSRMINIMMNSKGLGNNMPSNSKVEIHHACGPSKMICAMDPNRNKSQVRDVINSISYNLS